MKTKAFIVMGIGLFILLAYLANKYDGQRIQKCLDTGGTPVYENLQYVKCTTH